MRIAQPELESYLWGAATILRGLVEAGDYKQYVFPLLFYKRLSDVWDEEYGAALAETGDDDYARDTANDRFVIPERAHWNDVRAVARHVGQAIRDAMRAIEAANPDRLDGIFGDAPWTNKSRLPDATLKNLLEHFSKHTLSLAQVPEDELGVAYEFLIKKFADDSGHTAQEFYTNRTVVHLMVQMLDPQPGESVYDPTCGTGGMLISTLDQVKRIGGEHRTLRLYGQERNHMTASIARMNLALHGIEDFAVARGDTLERPAFTDRDRLRTFDIVLANPPYSIKQWNRAAWESDAWGRNVLGTPPQGRADYAFFQHILASMDGESGRCAILFPHGVLFRKEEAAMRRKLVEADLVECVLGLGPNLFYNSPMEACVVVCRSRKPVERQGRVLFIDAVTEVTRERAQSLLKPAHQQRILDAYRAFADAPGFARVATLAQIAGQQFSLSIPLYVKRTRNGNGQHASEAASLPELWAAWEESGRAFRQEMDELVVMLDGLVDEG
ncbi:class I SAM-dependent DNA methyltransferase [Caldilinea sp.]|uniref:type I restriction-modification system subunit M n=1 Tax=Caldilinea sp. TaxID=2293560 RepID=UPI002BD6F322|nr:class I SAM-dependent DNA methyltransferase [Caldilinea sp.]